MLRFLLAAILLACTSIAQPLPPPPLTPPRPSSPPPPLVLPTCGLSTYIDMDLSRLGTGLNLFQEDPNAPVVTEAFRCCQMCLNDTTHPCFAWVYQPTTGKVSRAHAQGGLLCKGDWSVVRWPWKEGIS